MRKIVFYISLLIVCLACKNSSDANSYHNKSNNSTGPINTVTVFCPKDSYKTGYIKILQDSSFLGQPYPGLYFPIEASFSSRNFEHKSLESLKKTRNILYIEIADSSKLTVEKDLYAYPQTFIKISGKNKQEIMLLLDKYKDSLYHLYQETDLKFVQNNIKNNPLSIAEIQDMGIDISIPVDYSLLEKKRNFIRFQKKKNNQVYSINSTTGNKKSYLSKDFIELLLYTTPYDKETLDYQTAIKISDSIRKVYLKGKNKQDYPITEQTISTGYGKIKKEEETKQQTTYLLDGYWSMSQSQFGGPMLIKFIIDKKKHKLYIADGFMFAPLNPNSENQNNHKKRDYLTQLQAIYKSFNTL